MILETLNVWPSTLPLPFVDYNGEPRNGVVMGKEKDLVILRRSRFERSYTTLLVNWVFTDAQFTAFKTFYKDTLGLGASQFKIELRYPSNSVLTEYSVRISEGFEATYQEGLLNVAAVLELVNPVNF